jgi:hypothetical protein
VQQLAVAEVSDGGAMWGVGERGRRLAVQGEAKSAAGSYYSRGEGGNSAGALHADHVRPTMVEKAVQEGSRGGLGRRNWWWRYWTRPIMHG